MKFITYQQYIEHIKNNINMNVKEKEVKYQFNHLAHHRMYDEKLNKKKKNEKMHKKLVFSLSFFVILA